MSEDFTSSNLDFTSLDLQSYFLGQNTTEFHGQNNDLSNPLNFKFNDGPLINYDDNSMLHLDDYQIDQSISNKVDTESRHQDDLSISSNGSTYCSSKHSPEYMLQDPSHSENLSIQNKAHKGSNHNGSINQQDDKNNKSNIPSILRKPIHKQYEPIFDGKIVYKYEENPAEYKKARKRLQNRESATRVRYRKKNFIEEAEQQIEELKKENSELILKNATLTAENNLLKQQISFLEKMVMNKNSNNHYAESHPSTHHSQTQLAIKSPINSDNTEIDFILPIQKKDNESIAKYDNLNYNLGIFRTVPQHTFKKHVTMLGIVTLVLCIGFISFDTTSQGHDDFSMTKFRNSINMAIKSINQTDAIDIKDISSNDIETSLLHLISSTNQYYLFKVILKYTSIIAYILYIVYIFLITNWKYIFRHKLKQF